jgi:hypothetical protein
MIKTCLYDRDTDYEWPQKLPKILLPKGKV